MSLENRQGISGSTARRIEQLGPWRYNHRAGDVIIKSESAAAEPFDRYHRDLMRHILRTILHGQEPGKLRALDLGCLEGHYTDLLCEAGFGHVAGVDLSERHLQRAEFLLKELKGHQNVTVAQANACDEKAISSLGHFNLVFFHGLLYHLKDPLRVFDVIERVIPQNEPFFLLLSTQYKGNYAAVVDPRPLAELQIKPISKRRDGLLFSPSDESVFERCSLRLNPAAVYQALRAYGYKEIITYDTPAGHDYSFHSNLIVSKQQRPELVGALNECVKMPGTHFKGWNGNGVNSYDFTCVEARLTRWFSTMGVSLSRKIRRLMKKLAG